MLLSRVRYFGPNEPRINVLGPIIRFVGPFMDLVDSDNFSSLVLLIIVVGRRDYQEKDVLDQMGL